MLWKITTLRMTEHPIACGALDYESVKRIMKENGITSGTRIGSISGELSEQARIITSLRTPSCNEDYFRRPDVQGDS